MTDKLNVTASTSFAPRSMKWSRVEIHNNRSAKQEIKARAKNGKSIKRNNININQEYTKYNRIGCLADYYKFMDTPALRKYLHDKNTKYIKSHHTKKAFIKSIDITTDRGIERLNKVPVENRRGTYRAKNGRKMMEVDDIKGFLRSEDKKNTRCGVITLGNTAFRNKLEHKLTTKYGYSVGQCREFEADKLVDYMTKFNQRHKHIKIGHYAIHSDEGFIHAHAEFMTLTTTAKGKPSFSFSKGVHDEFPSAKTNRVAMRMYRKHEDNTLVNEFGNGLKLVRTGGLNSKFNRAEHTRAVTAENEIQSSGNSVVNSATSLASIQMSKYESYSANNYSYEASFNSLSKSVSMASNSVSNDLASLVKEKQSWSAERPVLKSELSSANDKIHNNSMKANNIINSANKYSTILANSVAVKSSEVASKSIKASMNSSLAVNKLNEANRIKSKASTYANVIKATFSEDVSNFQNNMRDYVKTTAPNRRHYIFHGFSLVASFARGARSQVSSKMSSISMSRSTSSMNYAKDINTPMAKSAQANYDNWTSEYHNLDVHRNDLFMEDYSKYQSMRSSSAPMDSADLIKYVKSNYHEPLYVYNNSVTKSSVSKSVAKSLASRPVQSLRAENSRISYERQQKYNRIAQHSLSQSESALDKAKAEVDSRSNSIKIEKYNHNPKFREKVKSSMNNGLSRR